MQYRWAGEASVAERQSMQNALRETLSVLEASFDRESWRTALYFMREPQLFRGNIPDQWRTNLARDLSATYSAWSASTGHPKLLGQILVAEAADSGLPVLFRFNIARKQFEPLAWPPEFVETRNLLSRNASGTLTEEDLRAASPLEGRFLSPFLTIADVPAFVSPLLVEPAPLAAAAAEHLEIRHGQWRVKACLIVCLNREYISGQWLPALCRQLLSVEGRTQYDYLVRNRRNPKQVICSSDSVSPADLAVAPDASIALLQLNTLESVGESLPREQQKWLQEWILGLPAAEMPGDSLKNMPGRKPPVPRSATLSPRRKPAGVPGGGAPARAEEEERTSLEQMSRRPESLRRVMERVAANGWQLMVKHRSGSVEAAVAQSRRRNLAVSFGILLVLAASLVAFAVAVRSARRLARQQMEFVASISHELRTPVTAVCSLSENLADGLVRPQEQIINYGRMILREGRRLGNLVEQALEFAGMSSGRRPFRHRPLAVESLVREALQSCEAQLQESGVKVETRIAAGLSSIPGEPDSLRCALRNLIGNAVKYSATGGIVTIAARPVIDAGQVEIVVSDHGMGIEPEDQKHVFEPFYRGRNALGGQIRGAGIGLSLVRRIVEEHHGQIRISSRPGEGTEVSVRLPALEREPHGQDSAG